ncbi:MAG: cysteine peptidase family C39 domain-containing protein [Patescibacteria group bacterium]
MTEIDLKVNLIQQPNMSNDCGVACVAMIADYYNLDISYEDIRKELGVYSWGTTTPQLGRFFLAHGFDVEIVGLHPALFQLNSSFIDSSEMIEYLQKMRTVLKDGYDAIAIEHFISFVQEGGIFSPKIPTDMDIESELNEQRPVLVPLSHWFLRQTSMPPRFTTHFNVVTGMNNTEFYTNDPDFGDDFGGQHSTKKETFMYAVYVSAKGGIDDACVMKINKKIT